MIITKCAKRLMATVMTTAIVLTGFAVAPKEVKAAEENPTVTVKGATLRLDGNEDGKQSMRVGVEIEKADIAAACGMTIEYNGKSVTIATDQGQDKIYDYDETNNKVMYTAVINNIPESAFAEDFKITGLVKKTDSKDYTTSENVTKSINGIVKSLGDKYKLYKGSLFKKLSELDINNVSDGLYDWEKVIKETGAASEVVEYKNESCLKISPIVKEEKTTPAAVKFKFADKKSAGRTFLLDVNACSESGYQITSYTVGNKISKATDFVQTQQLITGSEVHGYESFAVSPITTTDDLYVKSFAIYEKVKEINYDIKIDKGFVTLSSANETINDPINKITYKDGKANVELAWNYGGFGVAYNLKQEIQKVDLTNGSYSKIVLNISAENTSAICLKLYNDVKGEGYWNRIGSSSGSPQYIDVVKGTKDYTFDLSTMKGNLDSAEAIYIKYNPGENNKNNAIFTINSIQLK